VKPLLQARLSQHLALTPQLQQSIRLLQLSTLELQQEIEQMLEQNPFLDVEEEFASSPEPMTERLSASEKLGEREAEHSADAPGTSAEETAGIDSAEFGTTEREDWENGTERDDFDGIQELPTNSSSSASADNSDFDPQDRNPAGPTLQEHLRSQLLGLRLSAQDCAAVHMLIESLNDDGYLEDTVEDIAAHLEPQDAEQQQAMVERLQFALTWLQQMEPLGVGAANLGECLVLQLRVLERSQAQMVAIIICRQHLDLLARRDMKKLMVLTGADEELIKQAQPMVQKLEPKPGRVFVRSEGQVVVPDVVVKKSGRNWKAVLNPDVMPKLRINDLYAQAIRQGRGASTEAGTQLGSHLQEARWFMKNILQRFETIQRVSQAIVERQKAFFTHGEIAMKPLVLREIAEELGLHESTISRVTTAKYMATVFGTFELKYFFGSSLNTDAGGNASSTAVRALIKQLIAAEDTNKPLSDGEIGHMLEEQGIQVARRTVAKYREALRIAPVNIRRSL
jgi:RNA polymerase sigma-54 factor